MNLNLSENKHRSALISRRLLFIWGITATMLIALFPNALAGQSVSPITSGNGTSVLSFSGAIPVGGTISLGVDAEGSVVSEGLETAITADKSVHSYKISSYPIKLVGNVTYLSASGNRLNAIDLSKASHLRALQLEGNELKEILPIGCPELDTINVANNHLLGAGMSNLMRTLPDRGGRTAGCIIVFDATTEGDRNRCLAKDLALAKGKNWDVYAQKRNEQGEITLIPYTGVPSIGADESISLVTNLKKGEKIKLRIRSSQPVHAEGLKETIVFDGNECAYTLTSQSITLKGNIDRFYCDNAEITLLLLGNARSLEELFCQDNQLQSLDLSRCKKLTMLHAERNQLKELDLSHNDILDEIWLDGNILESIELNGARMLRKASLNQNKLTALHTGNNHSLEFLHVKDNALKELILSNNPLLRVLKCSNNRLEKLVLPLSSNYTYIECSLNSLKEKAMTELVTSLYSGAKNFPFIVFDAREKGKDQNRCLTSDVAIARAKGWEVKKVITSYGVESTAPYDGCEDALQVGTSTLRLYPIPARTRLQIDGAAPYTMISVFSASGQLKRITCTHANGSATLECTDLPKGSYVVRIGQEVRSVIIE